MKNIILLLIILLGLSMSMEAQKYNVKIVGQIIGCDGKTELNYAFSSLNFPMPLDGTEKIKPDSLGRFTILKNIDGVKFFRIVDYNDSIWHDCKLLVQPNHIYTFISQGQSRKDKNFWKEPYSPDVFTRDYSKKDELSSLKMDMGEMYYNYIDNGTFGSLYRDEWDLMKPDQLIECLNTRINSQVSNFENLLKNGAIDEEFYRIAKLNVEYTQAYRLAQTIQDFWWFPKRFGISDTAIVEKL